MKDRKLGFIIGLAAILMTSSLAFGSGSEGYETEGQSEGITSEAAMMEQTGTLSLNSEQVKEMQNLLRERGYDVGATEGVINQQTADAIREFQAEEGLAITGTPTRETVRMLAPAADQQEFFGLSPEFGEREEMMDRE